MWDYMLIYLVERVVSVRRRSSPDLLVLETILGRVLPSIEYRFDYLGDGMICRA